MVALVPVYDTTMGRVIHIATIVVTNLTTSVTSEMMHQLEVPIAEHVTIIVQGDSEIGAVTFLIIEIHVTLTSEMNVSSRRCGENEVVQEARIEIGTEKEIGIETKTGTIDEVQGRIVHHIARLWLRDHRPFHIPRKSPKGVGYPKKGDHRHQELCKRVKMNLGGTFDRHRKKLPTTEHLVLDNVPYRPTRGMIR